MVELILAVTGVVVASALCSGSEAALFSVSLLKVRQMVEDGRSGAKALLTIRESMNRPIASIVVFNNVANLGGSALVGYYAKQQFAASWAQGLVIAVLTFLVILFAEIVPKTLGEQYCETIAPIVSRPVLLGAWALTPLLWLLERLTNPLARNEETFTTNEAEIRLMAHLGQKEGIIGKREGEMIAQVFELNDLTAGDLLTPRVVMTWMRGALSLNDARAQVLQSQHSRLILVGDEVDEILGFALRSELLAAMVQGKGELPLVQFAKEVRFVPRQMKADALLIAFRRSRQHIAVVLDEFGGVAGVVTLEDVLEVLTGEIMDETDRVEDMQEAARRRMQKLRKDLAADKE